MFKALAQRFFATPNPADEPVRLVEAGLGRHPSAYDIGRLVPMILPAAVLQGDWPGPVSALGDLPFAVTWAIAEDGNAFIYVSSAMADYWTGAGIDWRARAMDNLRAIAGKSKVTHEKRDEFGLPFLQVLLNDDAIGPSRLLVPGLFEEALGEDYMVAIPEQTCAVVFCATLEDDQAAVVDAVINDCFESGTEPMSRERFDARRFWVV